MVVSNIMMWFMMAQVIAQASAVSLPDAQTQILFILYTTAASTIITLIGIAVALYKESRNRRWDLEDRAEQRRVLAVSHIQLHSEIRSSNENTAATLEKADHFNQKLDNIMQMFLTVERDVHTATADVANKASQMTNTSRANRETLEHVEDKTNRILDNTEQIHKKVEAARE